MSKTEWKEFALGDIAFITKLAGFEFTKYIKYNQTGEIIALRALNLRNGVLDLTDVKHIDRSVSDLLPRSKLYKYDILFTYTGNGYGDCALVDFDDRYHLAPNICKISVNRDLADPRFVYQVIRSESFYKQVSNYIGGSSQPTIPMETIRKLVVRLPPLAEQQRIAGILSSLDDKIELNNKINDNLEKQAQALFKNWFIDYAPFGGEKPEDWKENTLGDVCSKVTDGSHFSPQDDPLAPYPMYSVKDMETYGFNPSGCKHITAEDFAKMKAGDCVPKVNDVLVAKDGSYLKEIFICSEEREEAILSSIAIFRPNTKKILPEILLFLLKQPSVRKDVGDNFVSGSALPRIVLKDFKKYQFVLPSIESQQELAKMLNSIRMQIHRNVEENQRLTILRDTLLPKLMSGEIDVENIQI